MITHWPSKSSKPMPFPRWSPDLNPLDFSLWSAIERRMAEREPAKIETAAAYKKRLRMTALRLPQSVVRDAVLAIPSRARALVAAKGSPIARDWAALTVNAQ